VLVKLRGSQVALGHEEAQHILVSPNPAMLLLNPVENRATRKSGYRPGQGSPTWANRRCFNLLTGLNNTSETGPGKTSNKKRLVLPQRQ
jgi:hypothetical protein